MSEVWDTRVQVGMAAGVPKAGAVSAVGLPGPVREAGLQGSGLWATEPFTHCFPSGRSLLVEEHHVLSGQEQSSTACEEAGAGALCCRLRPCSRDPCSSHPQPHPSSRSSSALPPSSFFRARSLATTPVLGPQATRSALLWESRAVLPGSRRGGPAGLTQRVLILCPGLCSPASRATGRNRVCSQVQRRVAAFCLQLCSLTLAILVRGIGLCCFPLHICLVLLQVLLWLPWVHRWRRGLVNRCGHPQV